MDLLPLILLFGLFQTILGEIFTTGYEVKELVKLERDLIDSLTTYFERQKKNGITFDSTITGFVEEHDVKNKALSGENTDCFENPISRYHVTKRLAKHWSVLKENLTCVGPDCPLLTGEDVFRAVSRREKRDLPSDRDLDHSALALLHIWNIYDLDIETLASGKIGYSENEALTADDVFFIANTAKDTENLYAAIKWFEYLVMLQDDLDFSALSFKLSHVYRKLASSYHQFEMTWKAIEILELYLEKDPDNKPITRDISYFKSAGKGGDRMEVTRHKDSDSKEAKDEEIYRQLCQTSLKKANSTKRMNCYIKPILGTYGTSKQEVLSVKPRIVLIYDVLDTKETNVLLKYTGKQETVLFKPTDLGDTHTKTLISGPMCEGNPQYPLLSNLSKNVEALTEFKVWPIQGITSSECYRFAYKGIGDESKETKQYWKKKEVASYSNGGNRYVTLRLQLSDVQQGGATVFPKLGIHLPNIKNSAVIWWNLNDDGKPNTKTVQRDCPVIIGAKWAMLKNIYYNNQYSARKCEII